MSLLNQINITSGAVANGIALGPDGNIYTCGQISGTGYVWKINPATHTVTG